jgi:AraC-like DNA-binding protein
MKLYPEIFFKRYVLFQITFFFIFAVSFSQTPEEKNLIRKAQEQAFNAPDETIKIVGHLAKKTNTDIEKAQINLLLKDSYLTKGDYNKAAIALYEAGKEISSLPDSLQFEIFLEKAKLSGKMHLYKQFNNYVTSSRIVIDRLGNKTVAQPMLLQLKLEEINIDIQRQLYSRALGAIEKEEQKSEKIISANSSLREGFALAKGRSLKGLEKFDESEKYLLKVLSSYKEKKHANILQEVNVLNRLGDLYFQKKEYNKAIATLTTSLKKARKIDNSYLLEDIYNHLAVNYLALNDKAEHQSSNKKFITFLTLNEEKDNEAVNSLFNLAGEEEEANYFIAESRYESYIYAGLGVLVLIFAFGNVLYFRNKAKRRRLKEIISYLEIINNVSVKPEAEKKEANKKLVIPTETEQTILTKLKRFENSIKYTSKDMSLATLAAQLDINTKYLSEVINKHYQDNFNTYINKLRINFIIEKLKNEPEYLNYKISYLAEVSGFSSHSSFATVFKSITGIAPTTFIDFLGKGVESELYENEAK